MNDYNQRKTLLFSALLMLAALTMSLAMPLTASAATNRMDPMPHAHHRSVAFHANNGKVTDSDGIIGNSLYGADARHPYVGQMPARSNGKHVRRGIMGTADQAADGAKRATEGIINGAEEALDGIGNAARSVTDGLTEGLTGQNAPGGDTANDPSGEATNRATEDGAMRAESQGNRGVIGWVVAILVVITGALVVLALLPKKQHDRR